MHGGEMTMKRLLLVILILFCAACATLRPVRRAFTPYSPTAACVREFACKTYGWCGEFVSAAREGDDFAIYQDWRKGSRSARVYIDAWPYCK